MACVALVTLGAFSVQPAQAKDRKSEAHATAVRQDATSASAERTATLGATVERSSGNRNGTPTAPLREQQSATPSALSLKFGAVTLQPAVGGIKGAKFSVGF